MVETEATVAHTNYEGLVANIRTLAEPTPMAGHTNCAGTVVNIRTLVIVALAMYMSRLHHVCL